MALDAGASGGSTKGGKKGGKKKDPWTDVPKTPGPIPGTHSYTPPATSGAAAGASYGTSYKPPKYYQPPREPKQPSISDILSSNFLDKSTGVERRLRRSQDTLKPRETNLSDVIQGLKSSISAGAALSAGDPKETRADQAVDYAGDVAKSLLGDTQPESKLAQRLNAEPNYDIRQLKGLDNMPKGDEIDLPGRYRFEGNKRKNENLKWWWDKEYIDSRLGDYEAAGDDFNYELTLSKIIDMRYKDKEQFAFDRTFRRSEQIQKVLQDAQNALYQGKDEGGPDFEYLQRYMEENPNFKLNPIKYAEDYGINSDMLRRQMQRELEGVTDPEARVKIREKYEGYAGPLDTYDKIRETYRKTSKIIQRRIKKYETLYNDRVEDAGLDADEVGPAIPEVTGGRSEEDQQAIDELMGNSDLKFFFLGSRGGRRARKAEKEQIKAELGVSRLPNVKQMLEMQVQAGLLDPDDEDAVYDAIDRLKNPAHPDTRGLYAAIAKAQNPDMRDNELLNFINAPYAVALKKKQELDEERAQDQALDERIKEIEDYTDVDWGIGVPLDWASDAFNTITKAGFGGDTQIPEGLSKEEKRAWVAQSSMWKDYATTGNVNAGGTGFAWTLDKLLRFNYAVAGITDAYKQNKYALYYDTKNAAKSIANAGYQQFFRGSDLPGIEAATTPMTFREVIKNQGERESAETLNDSELYQNIMGLGLDIIGDPTTYVGVGFIKNGGRLVADAGKSLSEAAVLSRDIVADNVARRVYGDLIADGARLERAMKREVMSKPNWVSRLTDRSASTISDVAWRARAVISPNDRLRGVGHDVPYMADKDLPPVSHDPTVKEIEGHLKELAIREDQLENDIATNGMRQYTREFADTMGDYSPAPGMADMRIERMVGLDKVGDEFFWRVSSGAEEQALEGGFSKTFFKKDASGQTARQAQSEIDELTTRMGDTPAVQKRVAELEKTVQAGQTSAKADVRAMLAQGGKIPEETVKELRERFAHGAGVKPEDLPFLDDELVEAVALGPKMLREADQEVRALVDRAYAAKNNAEAAMERMKRQNPDVSVKSNPRYAAHVKARNTAVNTLNHHTAAGAMHYLATLEKNGVLTALAREDGGLTRVMKNKVYSNPEQGAHLEDMLKEVQERRMSGADVDTNVSTHVDRITDDAPGQPSREYENPYFDHDFAGNESLDEVLVNSRAASDYKDADAHLAAIEQGIRKQLKDMRLDSPQGLTGLPPLEGQRLKAMAPPKFLTNGKLDPEKIMPHIEIKLIGEQTKYQRWHIGYKNVDNLTPEGVAFIRNFTTALRDRFNTLYTERNLHLKSEVTGIGVKDRAKNVFDPANKEAPRHVVAVGAKDNPDSFKRAMERTGDRAKSVTDDTGKEDYTELSSTLRNNQRIHQAIKKSDKDGVPPVVYVFTKKALESEDFIKPTVDYARERGVTVYHFQEGANGKITTRTYKVEDKPKPIGADKEFEPKVKASKGFEKSAWGRAHPDGVSSPSKLMGEALESGNPDDFYHALMAPGAPFNITDRMLTQTDDVIKQQLDKAADLEQVGKERKVGKATEVDETPSEHVSQKRVERSGINEKIAASSKTDDVLEPLTFEGKRLDNNLSKARKQIKEQMWAKRNEYPEVLAEAKKIHKRSGKISPKVAFGIAAGEQVVEPLIREYAEKWYRYVTSLDPNAQVKFFNDLFEGSVKSSKRQFKRDRGKALTEAFRKKDRTDPNYAGEGILGPDAFNKLRTDTLDDAVKQLTDEVNKYKSVPMTESGYRFRFKTPRTDEELLDAAGTMFPQVFSKHPRRTINESARDMVKEVKAEAALQRAELESQAALAATKDELDAIKDTIAAVEAKKKAQIAAVEESRKQALAAKVQLRKDAQADALLQLTEVPGKNLTEHEARKFIAAKRAELENGLNRLDEPAVAAEATAHKWFQNRSAAFGQFFKRPSAQIKTPEGREILALVTGAAPVLIKSTLERLDKRMGGMLSANRTQAFANIRMGHAYSGPQAEFADGVKAELDEITDIWNNTHKDYQFQLEARPGQFSFVTWNDMNHWLPKAWMVDMKQLSHVKRAKGRIEIGDVWDAMPHKPPGSSDPVVFAHTMRVAAGQAREARVAMGLINRTFGVPRHAIFEKDIDFKGMDTKVTGIHASEKGRLVEQLGKLGWKTVDDLGGTHYFHPSAASEIETLVRLIKRQDHRTALGKNIDTVISGWKGLHTTYSPPYYVRNLVGETLMAWLGGVNNPMYFKRAVTGMRWLRNEDRDLAEIITHIPQLQDKIAVNVANGKGTAFTLRGGYRGDYEEAWRLYTEHGLKSTFTNEEIRQGARASTGAMFSDRKTMRGIKKGFNKLHNFGEGAEDLVRFAHFLHALEYSGKGSAAKAATYAAQRVRKYHFDYSDVSDFEKVFIGRVFPFYKWTRFAAPVMLTHLFLKPGKMTAPFKALDATAATAGMLNSSDIHENTNGHLPEYTGMAPSWVRDLMAYQVGGMPGADDTYSTYIRMATPQTDAMQAIYMPDNAATALLNPGIKSAIELTMNQSMDPDFAGIPIRGGSFNEAFNINDLEATGMYLGRQLGPFAKTGTDIYRGNQENDEGVSFNEYRQEAGYDPWKQMVSNLSGLSVYQAMGKGKDQATTEVPDDGNSPPVAQSELLKIPGVSDRKVASGPSDDTGAYQDALNSGYDGGDDGNRGWINFGNGGSGWVNFGSGGFGSSGGYSIDRAGWGDSLMELIRALKEQIDQGDAGVL